MGAGGRLLARGPTALGCGAVQMRAVACGMPSAFVGSEHIHRWPLLEVRF